MENIRSKTSADQSIQQRSATYIVEGVSCSSCAKTIEITLSKLEGVAAAKVNSSDSSARVQYKPDTVSPDQMKEAVEKAGRKLIE